MWDINLRWPKYAGLGDQQNFRLLANAPAGATTLTVNGTGFTGSSIVMWKWQLKDNHVLQRTQLTAAIYCR